MTGANASADVLPSRTAPTRMSVDLAADKFLMPYELTADVTASATVFVSPRPAADARADALSTSIAAAPRNPAEVTKNSASASSFGDCGRSLASDSTSPRHWLTCLRLTPTSVSTFVIEASKSTASFTAPAPTASSGKVSPRVIFLPAATVLSPAALTEAPSPDACAFVLANDASSAFVSPMNSTISLRVAAIGSPPRRNKAFSRQPRAGVTTPTGVPAASSHAAGAPPGRGELRAVVG